MLFLEFLIVLIASIISIIGIGLLFMKLYYSPIFESRIFLLGISLFGMYFICVLPSTILNSVGQPIDQTAFFLFKLSTIFAHFGLFFLMLSILFPTISNNYENIFLLIFLAVLATSASIINFQSIAYTIWPNGHLVVNYVDLFSLILMISNACAYVIVLLVRIRNVSKIMKNYTGTDNQDAFILSFRFFLTHSLLVILAIGTLIFTRFFLKGFAPGLTWYLPLSLIVLYLAYAVFQDESFLFLTPTRLNALLILDKKSGMTLLAQNFEDQGEIELLLGNFLSAVNISLKEKLGIKGNLERLTFGDKVVVTYTGNYVTSFLIVTQSNFIINSIAKFLTIQYEKQFTHLLELHRTQPLKADVFLNFKQTIAYVRKYIPL